jgi:hypothetical protein
MQEQLFKPREFPDSIVDRQPHLVADSQCSRAGIGRLADELIEGCCGTHSLGLVYWFLRDAGLDELEARAEFELFLAGTPSEKFRTTAARFIQPEAHASKTAVAPGRTGNELQIATS